MNAPPTKPLAPLAPSAFDAEVRRRREEMKTWPDDVVWACQDLLGKLDEKLLSEERQRRIAVRRESEAYVTAIERAYAATAKEGVGGGECREREKESRGARASRRSSAAARTRRRKGGAPAA